jgi:hypothetical protein
VLTYWSGKSVAGHGAGEGTILDTTYTRVATVRAGSGLQADLHEFKLTSAGTALLTAHTPARADLSQFRGSGGAAGPKDGNIYDCHIREVDVPSGRVLLDWSALEHVGLAESYLGLGGSAEVGTTADAAFDVYHVNSIDDDGDRLLVSFRNTHAIYAIDRTRGDILWRLGGKRSDFAIPADAVFAWQHGARHHADGTITVFDDHYTSTTVDGQSRGLRLALDETARTVTHATPYVSTGTSPP